VQPQVQASTVYTIQMFAVLLNALKAVPEGAGNVLDNCAILASSDTSDGRYHNVRDYPILVAGKGGGVLKYPGIHYRSPTGKREHEHVVAHGAARRRHEPEPGGRRWGPHDRQLRRHRGVRRL
jgi:hypothetical protein